MKKISLVYISLSGNTESFVTRLKAYLLEQYENIEVEKIHIKDLVKEGEDFLWMFSITTERFSITYSMNIL